MKMRSDDLTTLVRKAAQKDSKAFVALCEKLVTRVLYLCRRNLGNWHEAEDAAQEVFIKLQKSISGLKDPQAFEAWLNRIILTTCNNARQTNMKETGNLPMEEVDEALLADALEDLPQAYVETFEFQEYIVSLVDGLPPKLKQCVLLYYYQKLRYAEIADVLDCKEDDVRNYLRRARQIMKIELEDERERNAKVWAVSPMIAIGPALEAIFANSAQSTVPAHMAHNTLVAAGVYSAPGAVALTVTGTAQGVAVWQMVFAVLKIAALTVSVAAAGTAIAYTSGEILRASSAPPSSPSPSTAAVSDTVDLPQEQFVDGTAGQGDEEKPVQAAIGSLSGRVSLEKTAAADPNARDGLAGVRIDLVDARDGGVVATQTTHAGINNGMFQFENVAPGAYRVRAHLPAGAQAAGGQGELSGAEGAVWLARSGSDTFVLREETDAVTGLDLKVRFDASVGGSVALRTGGGLLEEGVAFPHMAVQLLDPQGRAVAATTTDANGRYVFQNPLVSQTGSYAVRLRITAFHGLTLENDTVQVQLAPGRDRAVPPFVLLDTEVPQVEIKMTGGACDCGHINPARVEIVAADATLAGFWWEITAFPAGSAKADGVDNQDLAEAVAALEDGDYTLSVRVADQAGNQAKASRLLTIRRG